MARNTEPGLDAAYALETPDDNRRLYRDWATSYDTDFAEKSGYRFAGLIAEAFVAAGGEGPVLDAGCGTGLVAAELPEGLEVDGIDISPEMLAEARAKGRYRQLLEADLTAPLPLADATYGGLTCAGTFTHGHVGPEALPELLRVLRPGAVCAVSGNEKHFRPAGFDRAFAALARAGAITPPEIRAERIYAPGSTPAEGHADDMGHVIVFTRL